jgi:hypothetical protein
MGDGNFQKSHVILFENFISALSTALDAKNPLNINVLRKEVSLTDEMKILLEGQNKLYNSNTAIGVGAQLAIEWQAYTMVSKLYEGARIYKDLWNDEDKFHEACEFFYTHIGATEKEHKISSLHSASKIISNDNTVLEIEYGFHEHLNLIEKFWIGLFHEINRC